MMRAYKEEMTPLLWGLVCSILSRSVSVGAAGKPLKFFCTKSPNLEVSEKVSFRELKI